ncbi:hypothetical protein VPH35_057141 [Triticum aestivum]
MVSCCSGAHAAPVVAMKHSLASRWSAAAMEPTPEAPAVAMMLSTALPVMQWSSAAASGAAMERSPTASRCCNEALDHGSRWCDATLVGGGSAVAWCCLATAGLDLRRGWSDSCDPEENDVRAF